MVQHVVLWNYASVWKPFAQASGDGQAGNDRLLAGPDPDVPEGIAFASLMRKVRAGAAPAWWAVTDRVGHG